MIPKSLAQKCRETFHLAIAGYRAAQGGQEAEPQHDGDFWRDAVPAWVERHGIGNLMTWDQAKAAIVDALKTFAAHPPRTQGDARYRLLESGDVIQAEDEIVADDGVNWVRPTPIFTGMPYSSVFKTARRRIDAAIARQGGKDGG